jgi:hypothetical protein
MVIAMKPDWKSDPRSIRQPDPRMLGNRRIDGKPMRRTEDLFGKKKPKS